MKAQQNHFESTKKDFQMLKKNRQIPPQMQTKLEYLLSRIQKKPSVSNIIQTLPQYQKASLDQLNIQTGIQLFCNIVNCLSGKQVVLYFKDQKAYMRKEELFSMWKQCWITCDSNNILIRKKISQKPHYVFQMTNLKLSKNFRFYKKKYVFGACYRKQKGQLKNYFIGFDYQSSCARIHQLLRSLIREKANKLARKKTIRKSQQTMSQKSNQRLVASQQIKSIPKQDQQQLELEEELDSDLVDENSDKGVVIQFIKQEEISGDNLYRLLKNQDNLRQMVNKNYPNKLKIQILMAKPKQITNIFDHYVKLNEWNPQIQQSNIKIKISDNSYLIQVRVKKFSYMSWARQTVLLVTALRYAGKYYLVLRSTEEDCAYSDTVKMEWNQIVEISESQDKILVAFSSEYDFKGYSSLEDSQRMGLKVLENLKLFVKYCEAKQISGKSLKLFNITPLQKIVIKQANMKKKKNISFDINLKSENNNKSLSPQVAGKTPRKLSNGSQFQMPDNDSKQSKQQKQQSSLMFEKQQTVGKNQQVVFDPASFTIYKPKNEYSQISIQFIQQIRLRSFQKYYLKNKFDLQVRMQPNRNQYSLEQPNHYITQNGSWKVNQQQDLVFVNQKVIDLQKDVIKMIIKQLGSNIMSGKSIMNMSLPVQIFDNKSMLERFAVSFGYAPKFLVPASQTQDLIQQAKYLTLFIMGLGTLNLCIQKPFNPILGQTFQGRIGGIPIYFQQISHHPPISAFLMKTQNFTFHGAFNSHVEMGLNRAIGRSLCPVYVDFPKTNTFYQIKMADMEVSGLMHGQKKYRGQGKAFIYQKTNNLFVQWCIGKDKKKVYPAEGKIKPTEIYGGIYTTTQSFGKKFRQCQNKLKFDGLKPDDVVQTHSKISGHWCFDVSFNGVKMKTIQSPLPNKLQYDQFCLPSDSNYRLDLLFKRMQNLKASNQQKQVMQNIQRRDRKLRQGKIKPN